MTIVTDDIHHVIKRSIHTNKVAEITFVFQSKTEMKSSPHPGFILFKTYMEGAKKQDSI